MTCHGWQNDDIYSKVGRKIADIEEKTKEKINCYNF